MSSNPSLLKWGGLCAVIYGLLYALSNIAYIGGIGYPPIAASRAEHFQIISIYANPGVSASILVDILSYLFLFPALIGMMFYLRRRFSGLSIIGFIFGLVGSTSMMFSSIIQYGASDILANEGVINPILVENQAILFHTLASYLTLLSLPLTGLLYLLWGLGFRWSPGSPARIVGISLLLAFLFLLSTRLLLSFDLEGPANISAIMRTLMTSASFIMAGGLLRKNEELEVKT